MTKKYFKGSQWRKWDLHLHTPSSYDYKDKNSTNEMIINKLEENEIKVVAITDHHIMDIERIQNLQKIGNKKGITVLPGIEFLSDARGKEPIHFIGIFPENCNLGSIWGKIKYTTQICKIESESKKENEVYCDLIETIQLVHKLGGIVSIHAGKKHGSVETITNSLEHTIAQKSDIAKNVDIFELGKETDQNNYRNIVFPCIGNTLPMIICSDNHDIKNYSLKQNCWIKADPNFNGLRQAINEPVERVFIGDKPSILNKIENHKTKYIKEISIHQIETYNGEHGVWFKDVKIPINNGLVAIIGNKGSGKSAISDIISLCSNYYNNNDFSFLTSKKFREKSGRIAKNYEAILTWESGIENKRNLNETPEDTEVLEVKYIPQGQFENLTNEISSVEKFQKEIESVVFSHIPEAERLGTITFEELINKKSAVVEIELNTLKNDMSNINEQIIDLENKTTENYKLSIENKLNKKKEELEALTEPKEITNPDTDENKKKQNSAINIKIKSIKNDIKLLDDEIQNANSNKKILIEEIEQLSKIQKELNQKKLEIYRFIEEKNQELNYFDINIYSVVTFSIDTGSINTKIIEKQKILKVEQEKLGEIESKNNYINLKEQLKLKTIELESEKEKLNSEQKIYQDYLTAKEAWEKKQKAIIGSAHTPETIDYYKGILKYINEKLKSDIDNKYEARTEIVNRIFKKKQEVISIYKEVRKQLNNIIEMQSDILKDYHISVEAALVLKNSFENEFLGSIDKGKAGSFYSKVGGELALKKIIEDIDFDNIDDIQKFLNNIIIALKNDTRNGLNETRNISDQVKSVIELYNYLFSLNFLELNYQLKQGEKNIEQLSPGERGALLLVFYLLLDKNDIPLIIDQPEDNLDNNSVATVLVPFIREAKKKRQIIMVTHNPNLAVVADAEQIIYVNLDKKNGNSFSTISGSIENEEVNEKIVDVLEGAMPAFKTRKRKYYD